jgi:hypothetical protein
LLVHVIGVADETSSGAVIELLLLAHHREALDRVAHADRAVEPTAQTDTALLTLLHERLGVAVDAERHAGGWEYTEKKKDRQREE